MTTFLDALPPGKIHYLFDTHEVHTVTLHAGWSENDNLNGISTCQVTIFKHKIELNNILVPTAHKTHCVYLAETDRLCLVVAETFVCSENSTNHIGLSRDCGKNAEILNKQQQQGNGSVRVVIYATVTWSSSLVLPSDCCPLRHLKCCVKW